MLTLKMYLLFIFCLNLTGHLIFYLTNLFQGSEKRSIARPGNRGFKQGGPGIWDTQPLVNAESESGG